MAKKAKAGATEVQPCDCISHVNEALKPFNTALDVPIRMDFKTGRVCRDRVYLLTKKIDSKKRQPLKMVLAAFCPICGKRYTE